MATQPGPVTYIRDAILFFLGVAVILKQAGILLAPPSGGPSLELLFIGALFCNGPLFLSYLTIRRGTGGSSQDAPSSPPELPSAPPPGPSSGGE